MGTRQLVYTFTGTETANTVLASGALPAFTGNFTIAGARTGGTTGGPVIVSKLVRGSDSAVCHSVQYAWSAGNANFGPVGDAVNNVPAQWPCLNWTVWSITAPAFAPSYPAGQTITITMTGTNVPDPVPCAYGTRPSATAPAVALVTDAAIVAALAIFGAPWMAYLFAPLIGYAIDTGLLCGSGPPVIPAINTRSLLDPINDKLAYLQSVMWYSLCECTPGTPSPTPFVPPTLVQPPDFPVFGPYPCTNSDICSTLVQILKRLDELNQSQNVRIDQTTTVVNSGTPLAYKDGTVHVLSGNGSFTVSRLLGLRVNVTSSAPQQLPGVPPYLWNQGWVSVSDGGAMLQEQRVTRTSHEWFPSEMILTTIVGYYFNPGVTATITELLPR